MSAAIDCYDETMQTIKPRVEYFEKIIQEEKARNPFKELREQSGMKLRAYAEYFHIPKRTIESWEEGKYGYSQYLLELMQYKLVKEGIIKLTKGQHALSLFAYRFFEIIQKRGI